MEVSNVLLYFDTWSIIILRALFSVVNLNVEQKPVHSTKGTPEI